MAEVRNELPYMQVPERYVRVKIKGTKGPARHSQQPPCACESLRQCRGSAWAALEGMRCSQSNPLPGGGK